MIFLILFLEFFKTGLFAIQGIINTVLVIGLNILLLSVMRIGMIGYVLSVVLAYLLGSISFAIVITKLFMKNLKIT